MGLTWWDAAQPVVGGLAGIAGVHMVHDLLAMLRRRGLCPERWNR